MWWQRLSWYIEGAFGIKDKYYSFFGKIFIMTCSILSAA